MADTQNDINTALHGTQTLDQAPTPRTDLNFDDFRARLENERKAAQEAIDLTQSMDDDHANSTGTDRAELDAAGLSNHPGDLGTEVFMRVQDESMIKNAKDILRRVDRAMQKLDEGTYGLSDHSGVPIPVERLEVLPYANLTAEEQERLEAGGVY